MEDKRSYYEILGVEKTASTEDIKKAYRKLAFDNHPDRFQTDGPEKKEAEATFKKVSEAYQVLSNPDRKRAYDLTGMSAFDDNPGMGGFEEQMFNFFQNAASQAGQNFGFRRSYVQTEIPHVSLSFADVNNGKETEVEITNLVPCNTCGASGFDKAKEVANCNGCSGKGRQQFVGGFVVCMICKGSGKQYPFCHDCDGDTCVKVKKLVKVKIPRGVGTNNVFRFKTDEKTVEEVLLTIEVPENYKIDVGNNLYTQIRLTYPKCILGGSYEFKSYDGNIIKIKIPEGTRPGQQVRLAGKGLFSARTEKVGDLMLNIELDLRENPTEEEKKLLEQLNALYDKRK